MFTSALHSLRRESDGAIKTGITASLGRRVADRQRLHGWGWTPLNPRCWTGESGRRLV